MNSDHRGSFRAALNFHSFNLWSLDPRGFVGFGVCGFFFLPSKITFCKYTVCFHGIQSSV